MFRGLKYFSVERELKSSHDPEGVCAHDLEINAWILNGVMFAECRYCPEALSQEEMEGWGERWFSYLRKTLRVSGLPKRSTQSMEKEFIQEMGDTRRRELAMAMDRAKRRKGGGR